MSEQEEVTPEVSPLALSDEKFLEEAFPGIMEDAVEESAEETEETEEVESEETEEEVEAEEEGEDDTYSTADEEESEDTDADETTEGESEEEEVSVEGAEAELAKLFSPFKANGKEVKVENVEEAITLMQMGANYNKKMAAMKPNLKLLRTLENEGLLSEEKIGYLIDLDKKNPEAILKLIKDSGIDPLTMDTESTTSYKPTTYTVSDSEVVMGQTLDEIRDTESYDTTIDIVGNKWDDASRKIIRENPSVIRTINDHVGAGYYDKISSIVDRERMLGRLNGVSDIEAYTTVAKTFQEQDDTSSAVTEKVVASKKVSKSPASKSSRRKAANPAKGKTKKAPKEDFNPLSMSDDDFEKLNPKFT